MYLGWRFNDQAIPFTLSVVTKGKLVFFNMLCGSTQLRLKHKLRSQISLL